MHEAFELPRQHQEDDQDRQPERNGHAAGGFQILLRLAGEAQPRFPRQGIIRNVADILDGIAQRIAVIQRRRQRDRWQPVIPSQGRGFRRFRNRQQRR